MKILILGGTILVGRHIAEAALDAGHNITLFNRGQTNTHLFPNVEKLRGDRDGGLAALRDRSWDVVVDVNGYVPRHVYDSASLLKDRVGQYIYVSTGAVYQTPFPINGDESHAVRRIEDETNEDTNTYYGELKYLCERRAEEAMPGRTLVCRLGLVAGRYDDSDRATYWVVRASQGGTMVVPGKPDDAFQVIHGRDFGNFIVRAAEQNLTGVYNTTGEVITWGQWVETAKAVGEADTTFVWIDDREFLERHVGAGWRHFPLYLPPDWGAWWTNNSDKAQALGLTYRPTEDIVRDILDWYATLPDDYMMRVGLSLEQEQTLLTHWQA
ncbi:MAG: epimerase [Chloroflexi bacterium]|nr:MAG: epimerase [Chloroflexota bacterium]